MPEESRRRSLLIVLLVLILLIALLLMRCSCPKPEPPGAATTASSSAPEPPQESPVSTPRPEAAEEVLTPATLRVPEQVLAGAEFSIDWTGPANRGDHVTVVLAAAPDTASGPYRDTKDGSSLKIIAPIEPGAYEARYVTGRSHTILGRAPLAIVPAGATLELAAEVVLGSRVSVAWTGPNNRGDYITIVPRDMPDGRYANYTETSAGSPLTVLVPAEAGEGECRYMSGQGGKVLARRPVRIVTPEVSLSAPDEAVAGATVAVTWKGPDNAGDYIAAVSKETPDGQYGNYASTSAGSPLPVLQPILAGEAELRYMTGQGGNVLARRTIRLVMPEVTLKAPAEAAAGSAVSVEWTGPNHPGDYIIVVPRDAADGQYRHYAQTSSGTPASVKVPEEPGEAEIRYMTGQGGKVLARRSIRVLP